MSPRAARVPLAAMSLDLDETTERQPLPRCNVRAIHADAASRGEVAYQPSSAARSMVGTS